MDERALKYEREFTSGIPEEVRENVRFPMLLEVIGEAKIFGESLKGEMIHARILTEEEVLYSIEINLDDDPEAEIKRERALDLLKNTDRLSYSFSVKDLLAFVNRRIKFWNKSTDNEKKTERIERLEKAKVELKNYLNNGIDGLFYKIQNDKLGIVD